MNNVVARFLDGRTLKGTSLDVDPNKPFCHVKPAAGKPEQVQLNDLKALFFVRSLDGDPGRNDSQDPQPDDSRLRGSSPIKVQFADGETIVGLTNRFPPNRPFFFVLPLDTGSNNIRVLVNRAAVTSMDAVSVDVPAAT